MPKRSSKPPQDENEAAVQAVARLTGAQVAKPEKNPAAVALGRLGVPKVAPQGRGSSPPSGGPRSPGKPPVHAGSAHQPRNLRHRD